MLGCINKFRFLHVFFLKKKNLILVPVEGNTVLSGICILTWLQQRICILLRTYLVLFKSICVKVSVKSKHVLRDYQLGSLYVEEGWNAFLLPLMWNFSIFGVGQREVPGLLTCCPGICDKSIFCSFRTFLRLFLYCSFLNLEAGPVWW